MALVVGEDSANQMMCGLPPDRVVLLVVGQRDQADRQGPAATTRPGRVVDAEGGTEGVPRGGRKQASGDDHVAGGIADAECAPVDDAGESASLEQQVPRQ
jgi:hypothetical protein